MFPCNGWTYTWAVTLAGGTHVCLRRVDPAEIYAAIAEHGVTHMCGAPVVLSMLIYATRSSRGASDVFTWDHDQFQSLRPAQRRH